MRRRPPVIGVCAPLERARWGVWDDQVALVPRSYLREVAAAGATPIVLPPDPATAADPDRVLDLIDGLMLAGGADVDPSRYGAIPDPHTTGTVPERDDFEIALVRRAWERDIPVLGICRGMQVMNVARGGTLLQHLPDSVGHQDHRRVMGSFDGADHDVVLAEGTLAARAAGELRHPTKSHHHQGIDRLGDGLVITGRATLDELPETIEDPSRTYSLGVQWHPEADPESGVIASLVEAAREYRASPARRAA
ncbi:MAG: gamma-glutamyl-gamma-aminobutyrate hydrolase family protein [Actinomycetota bacterium]|nr:gamma-glutamyl-gamma-aminobutyrate hydrolase family protein [Actinomycetota bacterium]